MGETLVYPFRLGPSGHLLTIDDASDQANTQLIAAAILTKPKERQMFPSFGIPDPVFSEIHAAQLTAVLATYGPSVKLGDVVAEFVSSSVQKVSITYSDTVNA